MGVVLQQERRQELHMGGSSSVLNKDLMHAAGSRDNRILHSPHVSFMLVPSPCSQVHVSTPAARLKAGSA